MHTCLWMWRYRWTSMNVHRGPFPSPMYSNSHAWILMEVHGSPVGPLAVCGLLWISRSPGWVGDVERPPTWLDPETNGATRGTTCCGYQWYRPRCRGWMNNASWICGIAVSGYRSLRGLPPASCVLACRACLGVSCALASRSP